MLSDAEILELRASAEVFDDFDLADYQRQNDFDYKIRAAINVARFAKMLTDPSPISAEALERLGMIQVAKYAWELGNVVVRMHEGGGARQVAVFQRSADIYHVGQLAALLFAMQPKEPTHAAT